MNFNISLEYTNKPNSTHAPIKSASSAHLSTGNTLRTTHSRWPTWVNAFKLQPLLHTPLNRQQRRAGQTRNCCARATTHWIILLTIPEAPISKCMHLAGPTLPYKLESKHSPTYIGSPKNSLLFLTVRAHTRGRNSPPSAGSVRCLCTLSANAQRCLSIWQQEPWTGGATATIAFTDAKLLLQFVFTYVHLIAFEGFHACDGILLFFKQVLFYTAVKWTARLKGTQNYTPCEMGRTSTSISNTWQKLWQAVY